MLNESKAGAYITVTGWGSKPWKEIVYYVKEDWVFILAYYLVASTPTMLYNSSVIAPTKENIPIREAIWKASRSARIILSLGFYRHTPSPTWSVLVMTCVKFTVIAKNSKCREGQTEDRVCKRLHIADLYEM